MQLGDTKAICTYIYIYIYVHIWRDAIYIFRDMFIYIYLNRERDMVYTYIEIFMCKYIDMYVYINICTCETAKQHMISSFFCFGSYQLFFRGRGVGWLHGWLG